MLGLCCGGLLPASDTGELVPAYETVELQGALKLELPCFLDEHCSATTTFSATIQR